MNVNFIISSLIICALSLLLLLQCEKNKSVNTEKELIVKVDTIFKPGKIDTVFFPKVKIVTKWLKSKKELKTEVVSGDTINTYTTKYIDESINAKIISKVKGDLISTKILYEKNFPKFIHKVDTFFVNKKETIIKKKNEIYLGSIIGGNENTILIQPSIIFKTKKHTQILFGYEIVNKTYNLGFYKKITNPFFKLRTK